MYRLIFVLLTCGMLAACGLGETAASAAAGAGSEVQQAEQALKTQARVKQQMDAAAALDAQRREAAEASSQ
jgi:hypothetical protein